MHDLDRFQAVVIGASAGGIDAIGKILPHFPAAYPLPIVVVLHLRSDQPSHLAELFGSKTALRVKDAEEKEALKPGTVYLASPGYHLLVEHDLTFAFSQEAPVHFSRPSIDILFESAADALRQRLVGVLLTGANQDGAKGLQRIYRSGGLALIQDPATAQARAMPDAGCALLSATEAHILSLNDIACMLAQLTTKADLL